MTPITPSISNGIETLRGGPGARVLGRAGVLGRGGAAMSCSSLKILETRQPLAGSRAGPSGSTSLSPSFPAWGFRCLLAVAPARRTTARYGLRGGRRHAGHLRLDVHEQMPGS